MINLNKHRDLFFGAWMVCVLIVIDTSSEWEHISFGGDAGISLSHV